VSHETATRYVVTKEPGTKARLIACGEAKVPYEMIKGAVRGNLDMTTIRVGRIDVHLYFDDCGWRKDLPLCIRHPEKGPIQGPLIVCQGDGSADIPMADATAEEVARSLDRWS